MASRNDGPGAEDDARDLTLSADEWPVPPEYRTPATPVGGPTPSHDAPAEHATRALAPAPGPGRRTGLLPPALLALALLVLAAGALALGLRADDGGQGVDPASRQGGELPTLPATTGETTEPEARTVAVPDLAGMTVADARRRLDALRLGAAVREIASEEPAGEVVRQDPEAGRDVQRGATVTLVASSGPELVAVPDVVGLSRAEAAAALRDAGLRTEVRTRTSDRPAGTVLAQAPEAGAEIDPDGRVRLVVAVEPEPVRVTVPDVVGLTVSEARAQLRELGLRTTVARVESSRPEGTVVRQAPGPGSSVVEGGTVRLTVSSGPSLVSVPDVVGLDEASARAELEGAGFTVRVSEQPTSDPAQDGVVLEQSPAGGAQARPGAVVTIVVGLYA